MLQGFIACLKFYSVRYQYLEAFDGAMMSLDEKFNFMIQGPAHVSRKHDGDKLIVFERGGLLWIFNFNPTQVRGIIIRMQCDILFSYETTKNVLLSNNFVQKI